MKKNIVIIGCGSSLIYTVDIIEKQGLYNIVGLIDSLKDIGTELYGYKVIGRQEQIAKLITQYNIEGGIITIGTNYIREIVRKDIEKYVNNFEWINAIHPTAIIGSRVALGKGLLIMANVTINPGTKMGDFCHCYTGAIIEHDNTFEDYSSISANSCTGGYVKVDKYSAICLSCTVFDRIVIGMNVVVGSGSLVTKNLLDNGLYYGFPAKFIKERKLTDKYLK